MVEDDSIGVGELTAQLSWLDLTVDSRLALFYVYQMNRVNSSNDLCHDDSTINTVKSIIIFERPLAQSRRLKIIIIIIIIIIILPISTKSVGVNIKQSVIICCCCYYYFCHGQRRPLHCKNFDKSSEK